ncbi:uncharacterized protein MELLADRAFT_111001 [Melampsora larici-populina 98AG31]|uniref:Uncharacterized protein n=1 Tax=Melampsora larici-populina (strain 98AG31 / pathotype 3-4-7) TaxID=747676 RepID=F4S1Q5_MELLP|nr:uncharacterized protein MELLADRAFT_111001 [Melampsora larici-populina 98AG31]EGG01463.1 hypothetical protein MELLADRAFT_111001 [Melampsora larici-populina 98AG31]
MKRPKRDKGCKSTGPPRKQVMYEEGSGNVFDRNEEMGDDDEENDVELNAGLKGGLLSLSDIHLFQKRLKDVVLPSGITCLPLNLGETKHGKLKAAQLHSLFAYVIPLIILELYVTDVEDLPADSNM